MHNKSFFNHNLIISICSRNLSEQFPKHNKYYFFILYILEQSGIVGEVDISSVNSVLIM
jgi:hypothetical protein